MNKITDISSSPIPKTKKSAISCTEAVSFSVLYGASTFYFLHLEGDGEF
jgi:hypothetical protein